MQTLPVTLRPTKETDLVLFFQFQRDKEAAHLAAFTAKDPNDEKAYFEKHTRLLKDPTILMQTILVEEAVAGSISAFTMEGDREITYWIDRKYWGRGVATTALKNFLTFEKERPIYGRVAFDNIGSQKVLENGGFVRIGKDKGFANARGREIEEFIYRLA